MGDFDKESSTAVFKSFLDSNNLINLIKNITYFKGKGSSIDLIVTDRKFSFNSFMTEFSIT